MSQKAKSSAQGGSGLEQMHFLVESETKETIRKTAAILDLTMSEFCREGVEAYLRAKVKELRQSTQDLVAAIEEDR